MPQDFEKRIDEIEEKYRDKGDERYGLAKHNNTLLGRIMDDVRVVIQEEIVKARRETKSETVMELLELYRKNILKCQQELKEFFIGYGIDLDTLSSK